MPNGGKEKKKAQKAAKTASRPSKMVQYPAAGGGSMNVRADSPRGQRLQKANQLLGMKAQGKRLLQSEKNIIRSSFSPTEYKSAMKTADSLANVARSKMKASLSAKRKSK